MRAQLMRVLVTDTGKVPFLGATLLHIIMDTERDKRLHMQLQQRLVTHGFTSRFRIASARLFKGDNSSLVAFLMLSVNSPAVCTVAFTLAVTSNFEASR